MEMGSGDAWSGFIGVIIGAIISPISDAIKAKILRSRNADYLSIRIICILDEFAEMCVAVNLDENVDAGGSYIYEAPSPYIEDYPQDVDWKSIDANLVYKIMNFPNTIKAEYNYLQKMSTKLGPGTYAFTEVQKSTYARLGLEALSLSQELRDLSKIRGRKNTELDPKTIFAKKVNDFRNSNIAKLIES